ncbi:hypothetical protein N9862_00575 [bacterium]|nr:hypothetical protein [bacterium]
MIKNIPEISKQIYQKDVINVLFNEYSDIGPQWTVHQMEWTNTIYQSFKDHDKFLIVIYLTKKTLDFYSRNFTKLTYDDFYSKNTIEIENFKVIDLVNQINIPKESARRKVMELEKQGVILRREKKVIIDRSAFIFIKPIKSIIRMSRFLSILSNMLVKNKILLKPLTSDKLEKIIKFNFSYVWKIYYELQLPMMLSYKKVFGDLESFAIYGACVVNQHYLKSKKKNINKKKRHEFIINSYSDRNLQGLNAMSISDITGIPRATVVRKLKKLLELKILTINNKKHYNLTGTLLKTLMPLQDTVLRRLADFSTKIYNLAIL